MKGSHIAGEGVCGIGRKSAKRALRSARAAVVSGPEGYVVLSCTSLKRRGTTSDEEFGVSRGMSLSCEEKGTAPSPPVRGTRQ